MAYMRQTGVGWFGAYDRTFDPVEAANLRSGAHKLDAAPWSWMFYPPPYDFADPHHIAPPSPFIAPAAAMGLGCGCNCGGRCQRAGMGLFDTGLDVTGWGVTEWLIVGAGAGLLYTLVRGKSQRYRRTRHFRRVRERLAV